MRVDRKYKRPSPSSSFRAILAIMNGYAVGAVMIVAATMGCTPFIESPKSPQVERQAQSTPMSVATTAPGSMTNESSGAPDNTDHADAAREAPTHIQVRERRCRAFEKRDPPAGALAWSSDCFIKTVKPIRFEFDNDTIHAESGPTLDAVAAILHSDRTLNIEIGAHTNGQGSREYNLVLAQKRADAVKSYLLRNGIDAERLVARGFGEERPISHSPAVEARRPNRRIEFVIMPE